MPTSVPAALFTAPLITLRYVPHQLPCPCIALPAALQRALLITLLIEPPVIQPVSRPAHAAALLAP